MNNKFGEIVFDNKGNVVEVNGYDGNRKSFEYVELSTYYNKIEEIEDYVDDLERTIKEIKEKLRELL